MLKDCNWSKTRLYDSNSSNKPEEFYLNGLYNSKSYDLLLGYFSSSAINVLSQGFAAFISNGGNMRLVINHILSEKDKKAYERGDKEIYGETPFDLTDLNSLKSTLNDYDQHFFECLSYLISKKRIQIKVIRPKGSNGISHYKSGVFNDGTESVGYTGSCNFTSFGLIHNMENFITFFSWDKGISTIHNNEITQKINNYFDEVDKSVHYLSSDEIESDIQHTFNTGKEIEELIVQEEELIKKKIDINQDPKIKEIFQKHEKLNDLIRNNPRIPNNGEPRKYQVEAYEKWCANDFKGVFAMATGTGKTFTALNCLLNEYFKTKTYRAVIIVPTIALVDQWFDACESFNFNQITKVSSKEKWENEIGEDISFAKYIDNSFIVIVTYASFPRKKFQSYFKELPEDTIIIADEAHNIGSPNISRVLPEIKFEKRIGLSATPDRNYDEVGNKSIEEFFKDSYPFVYSYSMKEALDNKVLCPYTYTPHIVELTDEEMEKYKEISTQIAKMGCLDDSKLDKKRKKQCEMKLLERKRIIHKASNKFSKYEEILKYELSKRGTLKYTLVYVPEGKEADYGVDDFIEDTDDEIKLIDIYTGAISDLDETVKQFTSNTENREKALDNFENGKINALVSMKCLDEGVDVPRSELAIFCASTGNPRQFIQRRGRVLRTHPDKSEATIHDLVVVPKIKKDTSTFDMEKKIIISELKRVLDFSNLATNTSETYAVFQDAINFYNIDLKEI
jgi:superfamily II DNA or RNA helicase